MGASAAAIALVPVEEYLHSSYEPDCDYVDGYLEERHLGEYEHADLQGELLSLLRAKGRMWGIYALPELRVQVAGRRYRVPDVCVMPRTWKKTPIVREAPLLCIEILSPEDRFSRTQVKCNDYLAMGVKEVWVFDPEERTVSVFRESGMVVAREPVLRLEGTPVAIEMAAVFAVLDE